MRLIIDMQSIQTGSRFRGIGRYAISFTRAILRNHCDNEVILVLNPFLKDSHRLLLDEFGELLTKSNIRTWEACAPVCESSAENTWRRNTAELIREAYLKSLKPDFILITSFFEGYGEDFAASIMKFDRSTPVGVIFYDLIPLIYKDIYLTDEKYANWYNKKVDQLKSAHLLLSISEASKNEAIQILGMSPAQIVNISSAVDDRFSPLVLSDDTRAIAEKFGLFKPFLLYTSASDWRKNHLRLIAAYSKLDHETRKRHQLAFVGVSRIEHRLQFEAYAKECGIRQGELVVVGHISDEEMNILYNSCKAFIFPSWHEGFGLPALEAMQCGRAVIGSNASSIPEVIGRSDALFDPFDEDSISSKIHEVLNNDAFRTELEQYGTRRARNFSWDVTAKLAMSALEYYINSIHNSTEARECVKQTDDLAQSLIDEISCLPFSHNDRDLLETAMAINNIL